MLHSALLTDLYQLTMANAYFELGMRETAVFELFVRRLPAKRHYLITAVCASPGRCTNCTFRDPAGENHSDEYACAKSTTGYPAAVETLRTVAGRTKRSPEQTEVRLWNWRGRTR
jgi:hypothetical protein